MTTATRDSDALAEKASRNVSAPTLAEVLRIHDDDPQAARDGLVAIAGSPVAGEDLPRFSWLVAHVVGEKLGDWTQALSLQRRGCGDAAQPAVLRNLAATACWAGDAAAACAAEARLAATEGATPLGAMLACRMGTLMYGGEGMPVPALAASFNHGLDLLGTAGAPVEPAQLLAASVNNIVSSLLERDDADLDDPVLRRALTAGAEAARSLWRRTGTWVNHERADYLVALCANKLGEWPAGEAAAKAGLATIDANGSEDVDQAFLLLELARALRGQRRAAEADEARAGALALAAGFDDAGLASWFDAKAKGA